MSIDADKTSPDAVIAAQLDVITAQRTAITRLGRDLHATEQALLDERAAGRNAFVVAAAAHEVARAWERGGDLTPEVAVLVAAHRATTPSEAPATHVVVAVDELRVLKAQADRRPEGEYACTACDGCGERAHGGYYVPGEQFCEPPGEERCEECVGSGQREVQDLVRRLAQFGGVS